MIDLKKSNDEINNIISSFINIKNCLFGREALILSLICKIEFKKLSEIFPFEIYVFKCCITNPRTPSSNNNDKKKDKNNKSLKKNCKIS